MCRTQSCSAPALPTSLSIWVDLEDSRYNSEIYAVNYLANRYNSIDGVDLDYDLAGNITRELPTLCVLAFLREN